MHRPPQKKYLRSVSCREACYVEKKNIMHTDLPRKVTGLKKRSCLYQITHPPPLPQSQMAHDCDCAGYYKYSAFD